MSSETPLHARAAACGARFGDEGAWRVPAAFREAAGEVEAVHSDAGVADVSHWGHFALAGKDGPKFLQGLTTNDVLKLEAGTGCYTAFLNVHGRIEADCYAFSFGDRLVLQTPPEAADWLEASLGRFRRAGDFRFERLGADQAALTVQGPGAPARLAAALGRDVGSLDPFACRSIPTDAGEVTLLGVRRSIFPGVDVLGPAGLIADLWDRLVATVAPIGYEALDVLRLEAGLGRFSRDFDADTVLQELDAPEIVSFHKGCYLGQEIVARIHFQGQPSKLLRRLEIDGPALPAPGDPVYAPGARERELGRVTSVGVSPRFGGLVFAVVKKKLYAPGTSVEVGAGGGTLAATVAARRPVAALEEAR